MTDDTFTAFLENQRCRVREFLERCRERKVRERAELLTDRPDSLVVRDSNGTRRIDLTGERVSPHNYKVRK